MRRKALEGLHVLDFSWVLAGPLLTKCLGSHGAVVVRVESALSPEVVRTSLPYKDNIPGINRSGYFALWNANKHSLALNLNHPRASEVTRRLVRWADIVVENFMPGTMGRWGLDYEQIKAIKPEIIMISLSANGQDGPNARTPGFGPLLAGPTGTATLTGWPDSGPVFGATYSDFLDPDLAVPTVIAALLHKRRTGEGLYIDMSQVESTLYCLGPLQLDYFVNGREGESTGNSHPSAAPHGVFRCKGQDRWCAIAVFTEAEWQAFGEVIGNPSWVADPRFATLPGRKEHEEDLNALVENWTVNFSAEEIASRLQARGVPAGVVLTSKELLEDKQLAHRNYLWTLNHHEIGPCVHFGESSILSRTPAEPSLPTPCLGEHTERVCREMLGMSDHEFIDLLNAGVFE